MIEWATCIAVVYSITDQDSFTTASSLLDEINYYYNSKSSKALGPKCIGLLGNKRDLSHLREVSQKDGKNLAIRHGASFWEVSASEDYHSTHTPLNSMIVESYLNTMTLKGNSSGKGLNISPFSSLKGHYDGSGPRTRSETSPNAFCFDSEDDVPLSPTEWGSEKRRTFSHNRKKLELKLNESKRTKKNSIGKTSYDNILAATDNNNNNNTSAGTPTDSEESPVRTSSWSKNNKKRSSTRKSTEKKEGVSSQKGLLRSYSYSDLKTLQMEQTPDSSPQDCITSDCEIPEDQADTDVQTTNCINRDFLASLDEQKPTASFTRLNSYVDQNAQQVKSPRTRRERRKTTAVSVSTDLSEPEFSPKSPDVQSKFKRAEKKSVRRKISSIFKPKITLEAQ